MNSKKYNPRGLEKNKTIALRLMPNERSDAELSADVMNLSLSSFARQAYLIGAPILKRQSGLSD